jgi:hypothetical protein
MTCYLLKNRGNLIFIHTLPAPAQAQEQVKCGLGEETVLEWNNREENSGIVGRS